jgi:phosphatidylglycerophosphate synthase
VVDNERTFHAQENEKRGEPPLAVLNACRLGAWEIVGGVPLVGRTLFHLNKFGIKKAVLLLKTKGILFDLKKWQGNIRIEALRVGEEDVSRRLLDICPLESRIVYINAAHLIDARLIRALTFAVEPTLSAINGPEIERPSIRLGFLGRKELDVWCKEGENALIRRVKMLLPGDIDPFSPEIRGNLLPYFVEVRSPEDARKATSILIRGQQKQIMDLPAQYIDPFFENRLTRLLCNTKVTPNMITWLGVAVAAVVAWLFWEGYFLAGAIGMFVVEILDGVDGKLARTKLEFTKLGEQEHLIDYFYENGWYAALAAGLSRFSPGPLPWALAGLLIVSDTAENILYNRASEWYGKSIDLFGPFDAVFRRIAGRRNIYGALFFLGFLAGYPLPTFAVVAIWAGLTAVVHAVRLVQYGRGVKRDGK